MRRQKPPSNVTEFKITSDMRYSRHIYPVLSWIVIGFMKLGFRLLGYSRYEHGHAVFLGPPHFIELVKGALRMLREKDALKSDRISQVRWLFWYGKKQSHVANAFEINERFVAWKEEGILTYLIVSEAKYDVFGDNFFRTWPALETSKFANAYGAAYDWMKSQGLRPELCEAIRAQAESIRGPKSHQP